jgi:hypothetical protein
LLRAKYLTNEVALAQLLSLSEQLNNRVLPFDLFARPIAIVSIILALYVLFVGMSPVGIRLP